MKHEQKIVVYNAIKKHGDCFWNGDEVDGWNGCLFDEILDMLEKEGFDLKLVPLCR